jgi:hypothetical protein
MEPEGSLPHSQVPATCAYPELAQFSPYPHMEYIFHKCKANNKALSFL